MSVSEEAVARLGLLNEAETPEAKSCVLHEAFTTHISFTTRGVKACCLCVNRNRKPFVSAANWLFAAVVAAAG